MPDAAVVLLALLVVSAAVGAAPETAPASGLAKALQAQRYPTSGPVPIEYALPADGFVTLVIEDRDGSRIRNLISDYPRVAGPNRDHWDGRDDEGRLMPPATYRVRGLFHEALDVRYQFAFGNPTMPPWRTADGQGGWLANHTNPMAVLADDRRIYVAAPASEGPYALVALDYDGNQVWGGLSRWHGGYMARAGDHLYVLAEPDARPAAEPSDLEKPAAIELIRIDPATGREHPFPDGESRHRIAEWRIAERGAPKKWEGATIAQHAHDADWAGVNAAGLAALGSTLYASLHFDDKLLRIDAETGQVTGEIPLPEPTGLVADGTRLLAISGNTVVAYDPADGTTTTIVADDLTAPIDLAVDSTGNIYASDWADQMCVKVFSPKGAYLGSIGKPGGRPWQGLYDASGMLLPRGISIDARDRLWVAEYDASPRRLSAWSTATGELLMERIGRGRYGGMGYYVLPDDRQQGIVLNNLVELDWAKARWRVTSTLWRGTRPSQLLGFDPYTRLGRVIHHRGRRLLVHTSLRPQRGPVIVSELTPDGRAKPLAAIGPVASALPHVAQRWQAGFTPSPLLASQLWTDHALNATARKAFPWFFAGPLAGDSRALQRGADRIRKQARADGLRLPPGSLAPNANFVWSDLDTDGGIDPDEIRYFATPGLDGRLPPAWQPEAWSGGVADDDLTLYLTAIHDNRSHHYRLPVNRWSDNGVPVYEPTEASLITDSPYMGQAAWLSAEGHLLTLANIPSQGDEGGRPDRQRDPLVMFRPDGTIAWTYPSPWTGVHGSHTAPKARRGQLVGPLGVIGTARLDGIGEIFAFHTNVGTAELFTADGLYLGRLFRDSRAVTQPWPDRPYRGQSLMNTTNGGEWFGGQFFQRPDGKTFVVASRHAGVIAEVTGLDTARRLAPQTAKVTAAQLQQAEARQEKAKANTQVPKSIRIARLPKASGQPPPRSAFRWDSDHAAQWRYDSGRAAKATWAWNDQYLYVAFQVEDDTPMINGGEDVRTLFKSGDAAILELRTNPTPPRSLGEREIGVRGEAQTSHTTSSPSLSPPPSPPRGEGRGEGPKGRGAGREAQREKSELNQPAPGDLRLLFSVYRGNPVAVLYDYRRRGTSDTAEFTSVKTTRIDGVTVLEDAAIAIRRGTANYVLRAAVPLAALVRWTPEPGRTYPGDFGIVYSDAAGATNVLRMHWSNTATGIVSDISLEADIRPNLWGQFHIAP
jgi:hypothetical protein